MSSDKSARDLAFEEWDRRQDFTMNNRRQTAKLGFAAGWHARKIAELNVAIGGPSPFRKGWVRQLYAELREVEAMIATAEGRNWFRDKSGRIWIDIPAEVATALQTDSFLDAGIPTG